jgi:putative hydrolase of the HAD superfamily
LFDDLLKEVAPHSVTRELVLEMVGEFHRAPFRTLDLYDDAERFLAGLRDRVGFALLTNGSSLKQRRKIEALNLAPIMKEIVYCQDLGSPKPQTGAYRHLLDLLRCSGDACLYVGDNPEFDFPGAKGVSMRTVHLRRGEFREAPARTGLVDLAVESFDELTAWLGGRMSSLDGAQAVST